ncbi:hypothetical protein HOO68_04625 [Candidatus Gracilibacteria bacterium]|nr:hypothetical protein [Candidatus Gracilibacteria bacterium]
MKKYLLIPLLVVLISSCGTKDAPTSLEGTSQIITEKNTPTIVVSDTQSGDTFKENAENIQKKQEQIGINLQKISDPEFKKLQQEQIDIYQGKEIWTPEIKKINIEFTEIIASMIIINTGGLIQSGSTNTLTEISNKKNIIMKDFFASKAYEDYLTSKEETLKQINIKLNSYVAPKENK